MLGSLLAYAPPASGWEAALTWLSMPQEPQLRLLLAVCAAGAVGGLVERSLAKGRERGQPGGGAASAPPQRR